MDLCSIDARAAQHCGRGTEITAAGRGGEMCPLARAGWGREDCSSVCLCGCSCEEPPHRHVSHRPYSYPLPHHRSLLGRWGKNAGQSPRVTTPCIIKGSGKEIGYGGNRAPTPSFFWAHLRRLLEHLQYRSIPVSPYAGWETESTEDNLNGESTHRSSFGPLLVICVCWCRWMRHTYFSVSKFGGVWTVTIADVIASMSWRAHW
jgi:hypothetical protein